MWRRGVRGRNCQTLTFDHDMIRRKAAFTSPSRVAIQILPNSRPNSTFITRGQLAYGTWVLQRQYNFTHIRYTPQNDMYSGIWWERQRRFFMEGFYGTNLHADFIKSLFGTRYGRCTCTEWLSRSKHRKWRETKLQPSKSQARCLVVDKFSPFPVSNPT